MGELVVQSGRTFRKKSTKKYFWKTEGLQGKWINAPQTSSNDARYDVYAIRW